MYISKDIRQIIYIHIFLGYDYYKNIRNKQEERKKAN